MKNLRIKGLRSLVDTGEINLNSLTIAVGKNSSGKSTLLRLFPLIKQTLETKISEPLLWFGRYVDFGDFTQSISQYGNKKTMEFQFEFNIKSYIYNIDYFENKSNNKDIILKIAFKDNFLMSASFEFDKKNIVIKYSNDGALSEFSVNGVFINNYNLPLYSFIRTDGKLLPEIKFDKPFLTNKTIESRSFLIGSFSSNFTLNSILYSFVEKAIKKIGVDPKLFNYFCLIFLRFMNNKIHKKSESNNVSLAFPELLWGPLGDVKNDKKFSTKKIEEKLKQFNIYLEENFEEAKIIFEYSYFPLLVKECNEYLTKYFNSVSYIAPIRATAERYYRKQGLDIQDVDARGDNVPMIIQSMKENELSEFNKWLQKNFEFSIFAQSSSGHISIFVEKDGKKFNITDTGFGYSQILPIILLVWKNSLEFSKILNNNIKSKEANVKKQIVIEQPELHLHPKMQTQLIDIILNTISQNHNIQFLIETHSETIINHIGRKIEYNSLINDKVNVLLFEQEIPGFSTIKEICYTSSGYLEKWPIDFFQDGDFNC